MIFLKLLLSSGLTFLAATAYLTPSQKNEQEKQNKLNNMYNITVHHYNITITPRIEQNIFYGKSNVSIQLSATTNKIILYSEVECISEVWLSDSPPQYRNILGNNEEMIVYKPIIPSYDPGMEFIELIFANELSPGNYSLNMKFYSNIANDTNLTNFYKRKDKWWLMPTHFHILGARKLFPCLGEFISTAYNIIIQHHRYNLALSNMPKISDDENDEEMMFTHFQTISVLPTYLLAGIVTNFTSKPFTSENVYMWYKKSSESRLTFAYEIIGNVTLFWEREAWKDVRAHHNVDHLVIPHFQDVGVVNLGLIFYRERDIMCDKILDSVVRKNEVAQVIVHKMIKEFILHDVHPSSPFWFVDGLLRFCGTVILNKAVPASRIIELFVVQYQQYFLGIDTDYDTPKFNWSSKVPHVKVIIMLRMLQHGVNKEKFWNGIYSLLRSKVLTEQNFNYIMGLFLYQSDNDTIISHEVKIKDIINEIDRWINQRVYLTVNVTLQTDGTQIKLTLKNYNISINHVEDVSVTCATQTLPNLIINRTINLELEESDPFVTVDLGYKEDGWVIANIQQTGYYRVNYEDTNWIKISDYLNLPDQSFKKIHVLNRAQIIDDAFHFMIINKLNSFIFWNITQYLKDETDYVAWYPMFKALEYISSVFPLEHKKTIFFKQKVQSILYALLEKIKYEEVPGEDDFIKLLRQEAAKWACVLDVPKCKETANRKLIRHFINPERHKISSWKEWTYCKGLLLTSGPPLAHNSLWWATYELGLKISDIKFIEYLACSDNPLNIFESINSMDNIWEKYGVNQVYYFLIAVTRHGRNIDILKFILRHFDNIKPISVSINAALIVFINSLYSEEQLDEIRKFLEKNMENLRNSLIANREENNNNYNVTEEIECYCPNSLIANCEENNPVIQKVKIDLNIMNSLMKMEQDIKMITTKLDIRLLEINQQLSLLNNIQLIE